MRVDSALTAEAVLAEFEGETPSRRMLDRYLDTPPKERSKASFEFLAKTVVYTLVDLPPAERDKDAWCAYAPVVRAAVEVWEAS